MVVVGGVGGRGRGGGEEGGRGGGKWGVCGMCAVARGPGTQEVSPRVDPQPTQQNRGCVSRRGRIPQQRQRVSLFSVRWSGGMVSLYPFHSLGCQLSRAVWPTIRLECACQSFFWLHTRCSARGWSSSTAQHSSGNSSCWTLTATDTATPKNGTPTKEGNGCRPSGRIRWCDLSPLSK